MQCPNSAKHSNYMDSDQIQKNVTPPPPILTKFQLDRANFIGMERLHHVFLISRHLILLLTVRVNSPSVACLSCR